MQSELQKALREAAKYRGLYEVLRNEKFVGTSQKSLKSRPEAGRDDDKDEWDGTGNSGVDDSASESGSVTSSAPATECSSATSSEGSATDSLEAPFKEERPNGQGLKYNTMKAGAAILHKCDLTRIPADATIIKTELRSSFDFISRIEEHQREYVTYRTKDGHLVTCFYPMFTPAHCLVSETLPADVHTDDSILNCDETWCRVKMHDKYKKAYIWCVVNKSAGIVIFFYDEGSRGRKVLTDFIGDADLSALQSDAYNVYKYLDGALSEVEHICCMAHVRAKFQKALLQGKDEQARLFMEWIGKLYDLERGYIKDHLPPDEIKRLRNGLETTEIIGSIWMELTRLLDAPLPKSDLLTTALHYLKNAWTPVMAYRHDGRYCIDNSIAERSIRPLTIERKNKMAFGSHQGAETSTVYHTFTATCRMGALSFYQFLKKYFTAFMEGRTDFENLPPAILGKIN